nr:aminoglycoside phosphotransferase family protein [Cohnella lubricantis]
MEQGFEAEVVKLASGESAFVLKVWNKGSRPNIEHQYRLLKALRAAGINVSKPLGWGTDENGNQALLTSFDGATPQRLDGKSLERIARLQAAVHRISAEDLEGIGLPRFGIINHFFVGLKEQPDLLPIVTELAEEAPIREDQLIHGDFHFQNLLERDGTFTVIDWTNCQLGDLRYDIAWSLTLMKIYTSDRLAAKYREAYLAEISIPPEELERFEALAILRWILFNRRGGVPRLPQTMKRVKALIANSTRLRDRLIADFPPVR